MLCVLKCVISSSTSSPWKPHNLRFLILCSSFIFNIQAWVVPAVQSLTQLNKPILHNVAFKGSLSYWWFLVFTLIVSVTTDIKNPQSGWGLAVTQKRWKGRTEDPFLRRGWDGRSAGEKRRWMLGGRSEESSVGEGWDQLREEVMLSVHLKSAEKVSLSAFYRLSSLLSVGEWVSPFISSHPSCSLLLCLSSAGAVSFRLRLRVRTPAKRVQWQFIQFWVIFWNTQWHSLKLLAQRLLAVIHYLQNACKLRFH